MELISIVEIESDDGFDSDLESGESVIGDSHEEDPEGITILVLH